MQPLLPTNQTDWEQVLERVSAGRYPLDTDIIRRAKDVWDCPAELLPYLAYEYSVDLWDEAWPTTKKRAVIARTIGLSAIKGTESGISEAVEIMGGKVLTVTTPPGTVFLSVNRTPEERAAWLARMPQLRIYPRRMPAGMASFYVGAPMGGFTLQSTAFFRATPRVTLWRHGSETELLTLERRRQDPTITEAEEFIEARERAAMPGFFVGGGDGGFVLASTARTRVYTVRTRRTLEVPGSDNLAMEFTGPSLEPVDVRPETVCEQGPIYGVWCGGSVLGNGVSGYLVNSTARQRVYKRVHLYDPDVPGVAHAGRVHLGYNFRFGQPAYNAELKIAITERRQPTAFQPLVYGFWNAPTGTAKRKVVDAVLTHKTVRDRILLNTKTHSVVKAGGVKAGTVKAGQVVAV